MKNAQQTAVENFSNSFLIERTDLQFTWEEKLSTGMDHMAVFLYCI